MMYYSNLRILNLIEIFNLLHLITPSYSTNYSYFYLNTPYRELINNKKCFVLFKSLKMFEPYSIHIYYENLPN